MNKSKAITIIKEATKNSSIDEAVYIARILDIKLIIDAYEVLKANYSNYQIKNKLF